MVYIVGFVVKWVSSVSSKVAALEKLFHVLLKSSPL